MVVYKEKDHEKYFTATICLTKQNNPLNYGGILAEKHQFWPYSDKIFSCFLNSALYKILYSFALSFLEILDIQLSHWLTKRAGGSPFYFIPCALTTVYGLELKPLYCHITNSHTSLCLNAEKVFGGHEFIFLILGATKISFKFWGPTIIIFSFWGARNMFSEFGGPRNFFFQKLLFHRSKNRARAQFLY